MISSRNSKQFVELLSPSKEWHIASQKFALTGRKPNLVVYEFRLDAFFGGLGLSSRRCTIQQFPKR